MVHHFAKWMASPQFNHPQICDDSCKIKHKEKNKKQESIFKKIIKRVGRK
jgi:hypothetical protein